MNTPLHPSYLAVPGRKKGKRNLAALIALALAAVGLVVALIPGAAVGGAVLAVLAMAVAWAGILGDGAETLTMLAMGAAVVTLVTSITLVATRAAEEPAPGAVPVRMTDT